MDMEVERGDARRGARGGEGGGARGGEGGGHVFLGT